MLSSSEYLRKNFFPMYKGFVSLQSCCLIDLKSAKVAITRTLTTLKALGLKTVAIWSWTGEQSHPSDGWSRWLKLLATSAVQLLNAASLQWSPCELLQRVQHVATEVVCIPNPCSSLRLKSPEGLLSCKLLDRSFL